ncbi:unnamed protein product [Danaus chrysippus]|uniref:(African queen) hypothetical protein n=1 Tax=Danaus chrysippus TaxID=151541 RepID=A0A8J2QFE6_9NEOP|nr:unnamed protein product [Danaus chrysippus]
MEPVCGGCPGRATGCLLHAMEPGGCSPPPAPPPAARSRRPYSWPHTRHSMYGLSCNSNRSVNDSLYTLPITGDV